SSNTSLGYRTVAAISDGDNNTAIGFRAQEFGNGNSNTAVGSMALGSASLTTGGSNTVVGAFALNGLTTGNDNTVFGANAGSSLTTGNNNVIVGRGAGPAGPGTTSNNTIIGRNAGTNISTGTDNIVIGFNANVPVGTSSNQLNIGNAIYGNLLNAQIGIGTTTPNSALDVRGQIRSVHSSGISQNNAASAVDWNNGNAQEMSYNCAGIVTLSNLLDGGSYVLAVTDAGTNMCDFTGGGLSYFYNPVNAVRTASQKTVYSFQRIGNNVYVSWVGFQ
ncbi:MAG: hypothetical protein ABL958_15550, partial [Bdellovibrionia bacterium]